MVATISFCHLIFFLPSLFVDTIKRSFPRVNRSFRNYSGRGGGEFNSTKTLRGIFSIDEIFESGWVHLHTCIEVCTLYDDVTRLILAEVDGSLPKERISVFPGNESRRVSLARFKLRLDCVAFCPSRLASTEQI